MANCVYNLMGRVFNSEFELDNFLLNNRVAIQNGMISDIVFSVSKDPQAETISILRKARQEAERIQNMRETFKKVARHKSSEELDKQTLKLMSGYKGVTSILETLEKNKSGKQFVPKYIEENFKSQLKEEWITNGISDIHILQLLQIPYKEGDPPVQVRDEHHFNELYKKLRKAYSNTAKIGTALHKIFELYWISYGNGVDLTPKQCIEQMSGGEYDFFFKGLSEDQKEAKVRDALSVIQEFRKELEDKYPGAEYIPEYPLIMDSTIEDENGENVKLIGVIDLLIIDKSGVPHIVDYKFSSKGAEQWSSAKHLCHIYQQGFYKAGIEAKNLDMSKSDVCIKPFLLSDFNGETYTDVRSQQIQNFITELNLSGDIYGVNILSKVVFEAPKTIPSSTDFDINMEKQLRKIVPGYRLQKDLDDAVKKELEKDIKQVGNEFRIPNYGFKKTGKPYIPYDSYEEAYNALADYHQDILRANHYILDGTISQIKKAISTNDPSNIQDPGQYNKKIQNINRSWFYNRMSRYCTSDWEVPEIPEFEKLGILTLHNIRGDYYNFVCIDNMNLSMQVPFKKGKKITGNFIDDITPEQWGIDLLDGDYGNVDNMKVMLALNNYPEIFKRTGITQGKVGEIFVMNPREQVAHNASMKQIRDNFRLLCTYANIQNNFENGTIRCMNYADLARETLFELGNAENANKRLNTVCSIYEHSSKSIQNTLESLIEVRDKLQQEFKHLQKTSTMDMNAPETEIFIQVEKGIMALHDIHHVQEFKDSSKVKTVIYAPSRQESKNLQNLNKTAKEIYRLIRKDMNAFTEKARDKFQKYEKYKGFSNLRRLTINDEPRIYKHLFRDDTQPGEYKFRNPYTDPKLSPEDKELLKWALDVLYKFKHMGENISPAEMVQARNDSDSDYYDVPLLMERSLKEKIISKEGRRGFLSWVKQGLDKVKHPVQSIKQLDLNALNKEQATQYYQNMERFEILDIFELSDDEVQRKRLLEENGIAAYSSNLKDIIFEYANAKIRKKHMDNYIPVFEGYLAIEQWEANMNNIAGVPVTIQHMQDFINAKILDKSLVPDQFKVVAKGLQKIRNITTYTTLGFSPRSFTFQRIEGMFKNASRAIIRPNGVGQFGWEEYKKALLIVEGATKDFTKCVSLVQLLNEAYGLNDQDMNQLAKRLKQGMLPADFMGQMMWLTSIPDFYNRLTMFVAQMIKDGCFDAHEVKGNGLVYNWKKDKRFSLFANANGVVPTDPEERKKFNFQKALYHAKMAEFKKAGYTRTDEFGNEVELQYDPLSNKPGDDLPMAYTFNEANDLKSYADQLYGYYNHEDQMMLKSQLLGASYLQFRSWWSSLYHRYYTKGGVYNRTDGEHVQGTITVTRTNENGEEVQVEVPAFIRYFVDSEGNLLGQEITDEDTGEPAIVWKGKYFEGIWQTVKGGFMAMFNGDADRPISEKAIRIIKGDWDPNANEDVKRVRLKNMQILAHDMTLFGIVAFLGYLLTKALKEQQKKDKYRNLSFGDLTVRNLEQIGLSSFMAASMDLGAIQDLASPLLDWTPPSIQVMKKIWNDGCAVVTGDKTIGRAILSNIGVARQTKEYWYKATSLVDTR